MQLSDFDYALPPELIAQAPLAARDASRLMHLRRPSGAITHRTFQELPSLLRAGDLLVLNDARVIPARLLGKKRGSGGKVELLLVRPAAQLIAADALKAEGQVEWQCLGQASKGLKVGAEVELEGGLVAEVLGVMGGGEYRVKFTSPMATLEAAIAKAGQLPLPPYIERPPSREDEERYQTVYATATGSVAAPTAGLHFTPALLAALKGHGVEHAFVTLDVGPGTFLPVRDGVALSAHKMHAERCTIPPITAAAIARAKRVVAVGTTVVRTLESLGGEAGERDTALFILPGYAFQVVDALVTNFHLPKSTLLMLVSAFAGRAQTLAAYAEAVRERYRFFSYGDAMFVEDDPS